MVRQIQGRYDVSERCACRFLGFERTALRYVPQRPLRDAPLRAKLREMAALYPRWGLPRLQWRLEREGMHVNHKRTERLYRLEGLAVRRRRRKRVAVPRVPRPVVTQPNDTWGIDFVSDQLASGRRFRCFTVVDHCTREAPGLTVAHSLPSEAVIRALDAMIAAGGAACILIDAATLALAGNPLSQIAQITQLTSKITRLPASSESWACYP